MVKLQVRLLFFGSQDFFRFLASLDDVSGEAFCACVMPTSVESLELLGWAEIESNEVDCSGFTLVAVQVDLVEAAALTWDRLEAGQVNITMLPLVSGPC